MFLHKKYMHCEPSPNSILCVEMRSSCICVVDPQNGICGVCFLCGWSLVKLLPPDHVCLYMEWMFRDCLPLSMIYLYLRHGLKSVHWTWKQGWPYHVRSNSRLAGFYRTAWQWVCESAWWLLWYSTPYDPQPPYGLLTRGAHTYCSLTRQAQVLPAGLESMSYA